MAIDSINNYTNTNAYQTQNTTGSNNSSGAGNNSSSATVNSNVTDSNEAAVYETTLKGKNNNPRLDKEISKMLKESQRQTDDFKKLITSIISKQSDKSKIAGGTGIPTSNLKDFFSNLEVDDETRRKAQEDISEDGYYGVKKTSERIMSFAMAIAGNDPDQIAKMKDAVIAGFKEAEKMWGGELPDISKQTYNKVMEEFDKWEKSAAGLQ